MDTGVSVTHSYSSNSSYNVCLTVIDSTCEGDSSLCKSVKTNIGLNEAELLSYQVFPNPTSGRVNILFLRPVEDDVYVEVFNMMGQKVTSVKTEARSGNQEILVDLSGQPKGVYLISVQMNNHTKVSPVVIQ
jgi:hypothetical protein